MRVGQFFPLLLLVACPIVGRAGVVSGIRALVVVLGAFCVVGGVWAKDVSPMSVTGPTQIVVRVTGPTQIVVRVTGYCNCGDCCSWKRSWFGLGRPVYSQGPLKGKPKAVGVTSTGTKAKKGTIAADPRVFPFGTRLTVPGYGEGIVEDTGGSVVGRHIDVWFPTHAAARKWGTRKLTIDVKTSAKLENSPSSH